MDYILSINDHLLKELFNDKYQFYKKIKHIKKIKSVYIYAIIYHIFLENYTEIKNKSYVFNEKLDMIYFKILNTIQKIKTNKIKELFSEIIRLYDLYKKGNFDIEDSSDTDDSYSE